MFGYVVVWLVKLPCTTWYENRSTAFCVKLEGAFDTE